MYYTALLFSADPHEKISPMDCQPELSVIPSQELVEEKGKEGRHFMYVGGEGRIKSFLQLG